MTEQTSFRLLLKRYRQAAGLSQEALAARAGLSARAISDLERGLYQRPRFDTLQLLLGALALSEPQQALLRAAAEPEQATGVPEAAPPAPALPGLPLAPRPLIGRAAERAHLLRLLRGAEGRLVTITGPSGVGKTRLAVQVASELAPDFPDGAGWVALAPLEAAALVPEVVAQRLHLREQLDTPRLEQVRAFLQPQHCLLVLDNYEHLLDAATFVADLLAACPHLRVLVTSRAPLRLQAEQVFPLTPLTPTDAVALFRARAQAVRPGGAYEEPLVGAICERVDRLPLALELAAMQVRVLSLADLLERLSERLALLRGGARDVPLRQQTMREAIAWSYELLSAERQRCFRALGVCVGGWTLEAAEAIGWAEGEHPAEEALLTLAALVDASLVQVEGSTEGATRFSLLELLREYALERLRAAGEEEACRRRHASFYARLAERVEFYGVGQGAAEAQVRQEFANARAALQWAAERQEVRLGLRVVTAFGAFWYSHGYLREAEAWLERLLARDQPAEVPEALLVRRAEALHLFGDVLLRLGKLERAKAVATAALEHAQQRGDPCLMSVAWSVLGIAAKAEGKLAEAAVCFAACDTQAQRTDALSIRGVALGHRAEVAWMQGDLERATTLAEEGRQGAQSMGIPFVVAGQATILGQLAHQQGNSPLAKARYREALALYRTFRSPTYTAWCLEGLAATLCAEGHNEQATRLCAAAAALREQAQTPLPPAERGPFEQVVATTRAALGEPAFAEQWTAGTALTQEEALEYALSEACV
jgi:predicted ATPase/transcriptional regulator with XRE-family HTH domain